MSANCMGTVVPSMREGDTSQAYNICGVFLLFLFFTSLKNMQAGKKKPKQIGLVPLGIFFFFLLRLLCFILGLAICLLLFSFGRVPGLGRTGSGWFATPSPPALQFGTAGRTLQCLPQAGWRRGDFAAGVVVSAPSPLFLLSASHGSLQ